MQGIVIAGAVGSLGAEVVEQALGRGGFAAVHVLATRAWHATMRGLHPLHVDDGFDAPPPPLPRLALVAFDKPRRANGRDDGFVRTDPGELPALARWLHAGGVRDLVVVMPHAQASLPEALKAGLASLDEQAVASIGFHRLAVIRSARPPDALDSRGLQRLADTVLAQLRIMQPQHQQPLRAKQVALIATLVARRIGDAPPGTRVLSPERVWQAAQQRDPAPLLEAWLGGAPWPDVGLRPLRM